MLGALWLAPGAGPGLHVWNRWRGCSLILDGRLRKMWGQRAAGRAQASCAGDATTAGSTGPHHLTWHRAGRDRRRGRLEDCHRQHGTLGLEQRDGGSGQWRLQGGRLLVEWLLAQPGWRSGADVALQQQGLFCGQAVRLAPTPTLVRC